MALRPASPAGARASHRPAASAGRVVQGREPRDRAQRKRDRNPAQRVRLGGVTDVDILFLRNNIAAPDASTIGNPDAWQVQIDGVTTPRSLTVAELKRMGLTNVSMVLQCSGNGRGFFSHKAAGSQWKVGAAGSTLWSGVPLKDVVTALGGVREGMRYMTSTGGETIPPGIDPKKVMVERSVPWTAMEDAILAWELNGRPIPLAHGGPLRLIIPGYYGVNNIKYVKRVAFTPTETPRTSSSRAIASGTSERRATRPSRRCGR